MNTSSDFFFSNLPAHKRALDELLSHEELFEKIPSDWHIIITDIKNSTGAVSEGQYQAVNFVATGSIVTVLNIAHKLNLDVPFFFGGDGATFIVPPSMIHIVMETLSLFRTNTQANFNMEIRTRSVSVEHVYEAGFRLNISKHKRSSVFSIPLLLGDGLNYAEKIVKSKDYADVQYDHSRLVQDLSGMQCRWSRINPPAKHEEVVALLVVARNEFQQSVTFRKVMHQIDLLYGMPQKRQPISIAKLKLETTIERVRAEILLKSGKFHLMELIKTVRSCIMTFFFLQTTKGRRYLEKIVAMSDTLVLDGKINTVISGTSRQRVFLENYLMKLESAGELYYGLHSSKASVISCYVRNMDDAHIHFVDGSEGGYTEASRMLKRKYTQAVAFA